MGNAEKIDPKRAALTREQLVSEVHRLRHNNEHLLDKALGVCIQRAEELRRVAENGVHGITFDANAKARFEAGAKAAEVCAEAIGALKKSGGWL